MVFHNTTFVYPLVLAAAVSAWMAAYAFSRRGVPASLSLAVLGIAIAEWSLAYSLEIAGTDLATKIFWGKAQYAAIVSIPLLWFLFCYNHAHQDRPLPTRLSLLLGLLPALTFGLVLTTGSHGLIWQETFIKDAGSLSVLGVRYGIWFWIHSLYSYALLLAGTVITIRSIVRTRGLYRGQSIILIVSAVFPWIGNALYLLDLSPVPGLDLTPFMFTVTVVGMSLGIYGFRLIDVTPIARDLVIEEMLDGMIVADALGRVTDINPAARQLLNRPAHKVIGKSAARVLAGWNVEALSDPAREEARQEVVLGGAEDPRTVEIRVSPLYDRSRARIGQVILIRDISERKRAEQELAVARDQALEASRLKSQLLTKVSHELRTPLGGILGYAELLANNAFGALKDQQRQAVNQILDSTHYLALMVNELLDQAQLEARVVRINQESFSPAELLHKVEAGMAVLARHKGLEFSTRIDPGVPACLVGDPQRLQQILFNLVGNAIKFTRQGGVQIRVFQPDPGFWALQVADTGAGIPSEAQAAIFEPFRQVDNKITRENRGTGLGLSITKQLVDLMHGSVHLDSQPGKGSTFTILLPLLTPESALSPAAIQA